MGPFAIWLAGRSTIARTWPAAIVLVAILGFSGGTVAAALWGAQRTETSYRRLIREVDAPDLIFICDDPVFLTGECTDLGVRHLDVPIELRVVGIAVGRQTRQIIAWQAVTTVGVSLAIALPIGVIGGRLAWTRYATGLDVVPEPVTPLARLGVLVGAGIVAALVVAAVPAHLAARRSPVEALRSE